MLLEKYLINYFSPKYNNYCSRRTRPYGRQKYKLNSSETNNANDILGELTPEKIRSIILSNPQSNKQ